MTATTSPFARIAVIGCGLVGGSFVRASAATEGVDSVVVYDADPTLAARAADLPARIVGSVREAVEGADLVLLAVPPEVVGDVAAEAARWLGGEAVLTDVGSLKSRLVGEVERRVASASGPEPATRYVGGHPMAGSEDSGVEASDATLFQGATWVLTPTTTTDTAAFDRLARHLRSIGARVLAVDPTTHDELVAVTSHLPQVLATTLISIVGDLADDLGDGVLAISGGGLRDATRVAGSDPALWTTLLTANGDAVARAIEVLVARLQQVRTWVVEGAEDELAGWLARGRDDRRRLPVKSRAGQTLSLVDLVVAVADHPGVLADVTTALGEVGVNIEDLSMRHASEGDRGALVVSVADEDAAHRAAEVLAARGFPTHVERRGEPS